MYGFEKSIIYVPRDLYPRSLGFLWCFKFWSHLNINATIYKNASCRKNKESQVSRTLFSSVIAVPCQLHINQLFLEIWCQFFQCPLSLKTWY